MGETARRRGVAVPHGGRSPTPTRPLTGTYPAGRRGRGQAAEQRRHRQRALLPDRGRGAHRCKTVLAADNFFGQPNPVVLVQERCAES
ncbi:hypothetical protein LT493_20790 [Streptomyces tricolor]|nr:hypothetical protein [Streptomyces tricolor]